MCWWESFSACIKICVQCILLNQGHDKLFCHITIYCHCLLCIHWFDFPLHRGSLLCYLLNLHIMAGDPLVLHLISREQRSVPLERVAALEGRLCVIIPIEILPLPTSWPPQNLPQEFSEISHPELATLVFAINFIGSPTSSIHRHIWPDFFISMMLKYQNVPYDRLSLKTVQKLQFSLSRLLVVSKTLF